MCHNINRLAEELQYLKANNSIFKHKIELHIDYKQICFKIALLDNQSDYIRSFERHLNEFYTPTVNYTKRVKRIEHKPSYTEYNLYCYCFTNNIKGHQFSYTILDEFNSPRIDRIYDILKDELKHGQISELIGWVDPYFDLCVSFRDNYNTNIQDIIDKLNTKSVIKISQWQKPWRSEGLSVRYNYDYFKEKHTWKIELP